MSDNRERHILHQKSLFDMPKTFSSCPKIQNDRKCIKTCFGGTGGGGGGGGGGGVGAGICFCNIYHVAFANILPLPLCMFFSLYRK